MLVNDAFSIEYIVTCRRYAWRIIRGSRSDDWIYWCFFTITFSYNQYSAIADLHTFQFTVAHALGFSSPLDVFWQRLSTQELSLQYEFILSFVLQSYWTADSRELDPVLQFQSPWFLTLYSSVLFSSQMSLSLILRPTVSRPVCLGIKLGLTTRILLLPDSCGFVDVGRSLWREDGSVVYNYSWPSPAQSFLGPSPVGLVTIFYCLRFETSLLVASYNSQGYGGGIRHRLHTAGSSSQLQTHSRYTDAARTT
jgi:hypothetical protein